jgi:hypothetical protein
MIDVNELLEEAIRETENLNDGEVFLVKDLFKGYVWNRIPRKDRLLLGTLFLNHVSKMNGNLKAIEKTSSNQQRYKKTIDVFLLKIDMNPKVDQFSNHLQAICSISGKSAN